jgi:hypothetical protein
MSNTSSIAEIDKELALLTNSVRTSHDQSNGPAFILKQAQLLDRRAMLILEDIQAEDLVLEDDFDALGLETAAADAEAASSLANALISDLAFRDAAALIIANASITLGIVALMGDQLSEVATSARQASEMLGRFIAESDPLGTSVRRRLERFETQLHEARLRQSAEETTSAHREELDALVDEIGRLIVRAGDLVQQLRSQGVEHDMKDDLVMSVATALRRYGQFEVAVHDQPEVLEARARGREMRRAVWDSAEMLHASGLRLGEEPVTDENLAPFRDKHQLLGLPHPDRPSEFAYPKWQMGGDSRSAVKQILGAFGQADPWSIWHFFHTHQPMLQDKTPLEVLGLTSAEDGRDRTDRSRRELNVAIGKVLEAAHDYLQGPD